MDTNERQRDRMQMQFLFASIRVHSRLKFCSLLDLSPPHHNLFTPAALKIGKTTNGRE